MMAGEDEQQGDGSGVAHLLVNDIVVREDDCNLSCEYCLTGQSAFKTSHAVQGIFGPPRRASFKEGTALRAMTRAALAFGTAAGAPVVKFSGGELTLIDGFEDLLHEAGVLYERTVLLTNATRLTAERIERIRDVPGLVLQVSLDSACWPGNAVRAGGRGMHDRILANLRCCADSGLPVEVYTVLHRESIDDLPATVDFLDALPGRVRVFPFPVRGPLRESFFPDSDQRARCAQWLRGARAASLPHPAFLRRLADFLDDGVRAWRCHLPRVAVGTFDDGVVTSCPNIWFDRAGSTAAPEDTLKQLERSRFRRALLAPRTRVDACRSCFTPWDFLSLYLDGEVDLEALREVPVYDGPRTLARLASLQRLLAGRRVAC